MNYAVISLGYRHYLFRNISDASKLLTLLSKSVEVNEGYGKDGYFYSTLMEEEARKLDFQMKIIRENQITPKVPKIEPLLCLPEARVIFAGPPQKK